MPEMGNVPYEVIKEGAEEVIRINANSWQYTPSIEDNEMVMANAIDKLAEQTHISRVIFNQRKNFSYSYEQTQMLVEIAKVYNHFVKQKRVLSLASLGKYNVSERYANIQNVVFNLLRMDPIGAYVELTRLLREERIKLDKENVKELIVERQAYINLLVYMVKILENTKLISFVKNELEGYQIGERGLYRNLFRATILPDFMYTRLMANHPLNGEEMNAYQVGNSEVVVYKIPGEIKNLYHVTPPEFKLSDEKYELLTLARNVLAEHKPKEQEFLEPEKMRRTFLNIGKDLIQELAESKGVELDYKEIEELAEILVRYTVGFGLIEILLQDEKIQDVVVNGPIGDNPIFIVHQEFEECVTNITPGREDADSWASKFRLLSGRPLDEANPVLDTDLSIPGARARVAVMTEPLSPNGLAFALRRHRDEPWTLPLFIENKMINPLGAGLMSFLTDNARTLLISGTRSSGKTAFLGSLLLEIMKKYRIITVEDTQELGVDYMRKIGYNIQAMKVRAALMKGGTELAADEGIRTSLRLGDSALIVGEIRSSIRGNEEVVIVEKGFMKRVQIKDLEGKDIFDIYVPSMDFDLRFKLKKLAAFVKHPKRTRLLEVITRTGRRVTVTPDHSLFTAKNFRIIPIECQGLKVGDKIVIPEKLPSGFNDTASINLLELLEDQNCKLVGYEEDLKQIIKKIGWKRASLIANCSNDIYQYLRKSTQHTNIPIKAYNDLAVNADYEIDAQTLQIKRGTSKVLNAEVIVNEDFCRFLGYYISEGYTDVNGNVVLSNNEPVIKEDIQTLSKKLFGIEPYLRKTEGLGVSTQICLRNKIVGLVLKKLGCGRIALEKRVPSLIFGLSENKICAFLQGYFDGDGSQTSLKSSGNRVACSTISKGLADDILYLFLQLGIVARCYQKKPSGIGKHTGYVVEFKQRKYVELFLKKVGFKKYTKQLIKRSVPHSSLNTISYDIETLEKHVKLRRKFRHLRKYGSCGKEYLKKVVEEAEYSSEAIKEFVQGDFFLDEIKTIKEVELKEGEYVYDLSVESCQNFIGGFGGVMLHNTEALALYEAMRVGALANVVAGTIHGASPYGVYDRVVNDLKVPKTSFKATDIIVVANPVKSADGLKKIKRITQITEVRKHWEDDPLREKGFVDLMKYNPKTDTLEATEDLINGDSEIIKSVAGNIREFVGNWDGVWENIQLRAKIKETLVEYARKTGLRELLEGKFVVLSNDMFHQIISEVMEEVGSLDNRRIFFEWDEWLKKEIKKRKIT